MYQTQKHNLMRWMEYLGNLIWDGCQLAHSWKKILRIWKSHLN